MTPIKKVVEDPARAIYVARRRWWRHIGSSKRCLKYYLGLDPVERYWIDPEHVKYCTVGRSSQPGDYHADIACRFEPIGRFYSEIEPVQWGSIKSGNWDKDVVKVSELLVYQGIRERVVDELPWTDTSLFQAHFSRIKSGYQSFGQTTREGLINKLESIDELHDNIKEHGYKSQRELGRPFDPHAEVIVNIDRNGKPVFNGQGRHRLSIAKILDIKEIPVTILVKHADTT